MSYQYLILALALLIPTPAAFAEDAVVGQHCDVNKSFGIADKTDFLNFDATLRKAVQTGDSTAVALLVKYPLFVNVGFPIEMPNASVLQDHFQEIFTPVVRNAVLSQDMKNIVCGQDVAMYADEKAMITVKPVSVGASKEFRVTGVSLLPDPKSFLTSKRLVKFICHAPKYDIVVDTLNNSYEPARYRSWKRPHTVFDKPDMEIDDGVYDGGGTQSCAHLSWAFKNGNTKYEIGQPSCVHAKGPEGSIGFLDIIVGDKPVETLWCYQ